MRLGPLRWLLPSLRAMPCASCSIPSSPTLSPPACSQTSPAPTLAGHDEAARCLQHFSATLMLVLCREGGEGGGQEVESLVADLRHDLADMRRERDRYRHLCLACSVVVCGTATRS